MREVHKSNRFFFSSSADSWVESEGAKEIIRERVRDRRGAREGDKREEHCSPGSHGKSTGSSEMQQI